MSAFHLSGIFRDGMIAACDKPFRVWGFGDGAEAVFELSDGRDCERVRAAGAHGAFEAVFSARPAGEREYTLTASCGGERVTVRGVLFGEVWLAIGQSNMSYGLSAVERSEEMLCRASRCGVRVFDLYEPAVSSTEELRRPAFPEREFKLPDYAWKRGEELADVSAISVMTATFLAEKKKIPVGVVHASMGGLSIETYLPREEVEALPEEVEFLKQAGRYISVEDYNRNGERNFTQLSGVYNEKIAPLAGYGLTGVIWHLGESSAWDYPFARHYARQLELLVSSYRARLGDLPFVMIQIAPEYYAYGDGYGYLYINEAMEDAARRLPDCRAVPVYDVEPRWLKENGDTYFHPIHPVNKYPVAERAAAAILAGGETCPHIAACRFESGRAVCSVAGGRGLRPGARFFGFALKGAAGKYYAADARAVSDSEIEVVSPDVGDAEGVAYAFCQYQEYCDARDRAGNPLFPYRSERAPVNDGYWFHPPYLTCCQPRVSENCFGYDAGIAQKLPTWTSGQIYRAPVRIGYDRRVKVSGKSSLKISAVPLNSRYFFFGASPNICLSGQKHHLDGYAYLDLALRADAPVEFWGVAVRLACGEVRRFRPLAAGSPAPNVPVTDGFLRYTVSLGEWLTEESSVLAAGRADRSAICAAEFLFRGKSPCAVWLCDMRLTDAAASRDYGERETDGGSRRSDTVLPSNR